MLAETLKPLIPYLEPALLAEMESRSLLRTFPVGTLLLKPGEYVHGLPILIKGRVKVRREGEDKDLLLYYIQPGESCIMSFSLCLHPGESQVSAIVEEDAELLLIPVEVLLNWLRKYPSLNRFVLDLYQKRYLDMLGMVDQLLFHRLDERILHYLQEKATLEKTSRLTLTHQQIADDVGSSREVVSRVLKKWEAQGKIRLGRHEVEVLG